VVAFRIGPNGRGHGVTLLNSSGDSNFDKGALLAVERVKLEEFPLDTEVLATFSIRIIPTAGSKLAQPDSTT
jgi:TonB family protein